jgi:hypothetical protein
VSTHVRWIVLVSVVSALAVFLVVQDRVTAAGIRRFVVLFAGLGVAAAASRRKGRHTSRVDA